MTRLARHERDLNLVCDFPFRESFRDSLLEQLRNIAAETDASGENDCCAPETMCLDEDDLGMIAGGENDARPPTDPL